MKILVNIDVPELAPAIEFYCAALEEMEFSRILDNDVAELIGASSVIYLLAKVDGSSPTSAATVTRQYARHWTPVHIDFVVEDLPRATDLAIKAGAVQESECVAWRGSKCITFSDPFGHGFCLIEFAGESYDS